MRFREVRALSSLVGAVGALLLAQEPFFSQNDGGLALKAPTAATVPFVGCESDGQVGPLEAPSGKSVMLPIAPSTANRLAYYRAESGFGILGPRGWKCFGVYGSGGSTLFVSPQESNGPRLFVEASTRFSGPVVAISFSNGDTVGRYTVAEMIARVFPSRLAYAAEVVEILDQTIESLPSGPFPADLLIYRNSRVVEYRTPPQSEGLGTQIRIEKNAVPIDGVVILAGQARPDLVHVAVRLPSELRDLTPAILSAVEEQVASRGSER